MFTGGDLIEITCQHPTIGLIRLAPKGSEDTEIDPGGYMNQDSDDSVTGDGQNIVVKNAKRWSVVTPPIGLSESPNNLIQLQQVIDSAEEAVWTFTFIDNSVYKGTGTIMGDLKGNKNTAMINSIKVGGGGRLEKIA